MDEYKRVLVHFNGFFDNTQDHSSFVAEFRVLELPVIIA
jgi:hypothetical protein